MKKTMIVTSVLMYLLFALFFVFVLGGSMWAIVFGLAIGELWSIKERFKGSSKTINTLHIISFVLLAITSLEVFGQASVAIFFVLLVAYSYVNGISFLQTYSTENDKEGATKL